MSELPSHEVEIDPAAFLPEGVAFETSDGPGSADGLEEAHLEDDPELQGPDPVLSSGLVGTPSAAVDDDGATGVDDGDDGDREVAADGDAAAEAVERAPVPEGGTGDADGGGASIDLDALRQIELDLDAVDAAIAALDAGTYGTDPATGAPIDDALLAADPTRLS
jgi:hypothetical protein